MLERGVEGAIGIEAGNDLIGIAGIRGADDHDLAGGSDKEIGQFVVAAQRGVELYGAVISERSVGRTVGMEAHQEDVAVLALDESAGV